MFMDEPPVPTSTSPLPRLAAFGVAATAVLFGLAAVGASGASAGRQHRLLPDITTLKIDAADLVLRSSAGRTVLRLSNQIANRGRGPLEIYPSAKSHDCDGNGNLSNDRDALQRIFLDANGDHVFERKTDTRSQRTKFGCERYDPRANHWNVFDLARYELKRARTGKTVAKTTKVAFCTVDSERTFPNLPGSPTSRYYPRGGCDEDSILGISVGWADEYYYELPGQSLNVTGVKAGRYCLLSTGDPDNLLRESNNSNNTRRTLLEFHPGKGTVKTLPGRCRLS
jgi:Lysyl oxidase